MTNSVHDGASASQAPCRSVEHGEEAVARRVHLTPSVPLELEADDGVVALEDLPPKAVAPNRGSVGRADDVGYEHGGEHTVLVRCVALAPEELLYLSDERLDVVEVPKMVLPG